MTYYDTDESMSGVSKRIKYYTLHEYMEEPFFFNNHIYNFLSSLTSIMTKECSNKIFRLQSGKYFMFYSSSSHEKI
jgi:hypothetical protein